MGACHFYLLGKCLLLVLSDTLLNSIDEALQVHSTTFAHHADRCLGIMMRAKGEESILKAGLISARAPLSQG